MEFPLRTCREERCEEREEERRNSEASENRGSRESDKSGGFMSVINSCDIADRFSDLGPRFPAFRRPFADLSPTFRRTLFNPP